MKCFTKYISVCLLLASLFFIIPLNLVHELCCNHTDTVDTPLTSQTAIGNHHHHCEVLQLAATDFISPDISNNVNEKISFFEHFLFTTTSFIADFSFSFFLRGPPVS